MTLRGADAATVRAALDAGDPLPGTPGFAGELDGRLVRDVLGRQPLFSATDDPARWSFDPADLDDPHRLPAGHFRPIDPDGKNGDAEDDGHEYGDGAGDGEGDGCGSGDWQAWNLPDPEPVAPVEDAVTAVRTAVRNTVEGIDADGLAVAFSGGVDSAALAALVDAPLYAAGFPGSHDLDAARTAADRLGRSLRTVELSHGDLESAVPAVAAATGRTNAMDVQIALPLYLTASRATADGFDRLLLGQGADELFGGYAKVAGAPTDQRVDATTVRGATREVIATLPDQLERDVLALRRAGVEPVVPYLHDRVVRTALELPGELLVTPDGERKHALRRAVAAWLPDAVAGREKKALQYGSLVARELDRLARQAGFKRRMGDHVTKYVESLL